MTILGILLAILKTIGIILLILLLVILLLLLLVLFVPIRYRIHADKEGWDMNAGANVTWLLHMLAVDVAYGIRDNGDRGLTKDIRIFGISIFKVKEWLSKRKRKKPRKDSPDTSKAEVYEDTGSTVDHSAKAPPGPDVDHPQEIRIGKLSEETASQTVAIEKSSVETPPMESGSPADKASYGSSEDEAVAFEDEKPRGSLLQKILDIIFRILQKAAELLLRVPGGIVNLALYLLMKVIRFIVRFFCLPGKIVSLIGSITDKALTIWGKFTLISDFFFDDRTQDAIHLVFTQLGHLIGHIRPRTLSGYLDFGFDDPSITGRVLGCLSLFLPQCGKTFDINPDFENVLFNCDINSSGRIYLFYIVYVLIRTILDKDIKYTYRYFKHLKKELSQASA